MAKDLKRDLKRLQKSFGGWEKAYCKKSGERNEWTTHPSGKARLQRTCAHTPQSGRQKTDLMVMK